MHEVSIAEGIVSAVLKTLGNHSVPRILSVRVAVGELAGVDCVACGKTVALPRHGDACPVCGGWRLAPVAGHELKVLDFEIPETPTT